MNIGYETVVISINTLDNAFLNRAEDVVDTLSWSNYDLSAGENFSGAFEPSLSLVTDGRWHSHSQYPDYWYLKWLDVSTLENLEELGFHNVTEIYDRSPTEEVPPTPDELVAWLKGHDHLDWTNEREVPVGGVPSMRLDVRVTSIPENVHTDCRDICVPVWYQGDDFYYALEDGYVNRLYVLPVEEKTVVISIASPSGEFEDVQREVQQVIDSVKWRH